MLNIVPREDKYRFVTLILRDEKGRRGRFTGQNLKSDPLTLLELPEYCLH